MAKRTTPKKVNQPEVIEIDIDDFEIGEIEDFEALSGVSFDEVLAGKKSTQMLKFLVWIVKRRTNPNFTLEDARKIKMGEFNMAPSGDQSPTVPAN